MTIDRKRTPNLTHNAIFIITIDMKSLHTYASTPGAKAN